MLMGEDKHFTKPFINLAFHKTPNNKEIVNQILAGIEEESVLWKAEECHAAKDAIALAHSCAEASPLGVGVGVDSKSSAAVHLKRLSPREPLFFLPGEQGGTAQWRILGSHAARVVKGLPFKDDNEKDRAREEIQDLTSLITKKVLEILTKKEIRG